MKPNSISTWISLLLLLASFLLAGCRDVRSFLWRQTHHHRGGYVRHEKSVRHMGAAFRRPVPPPIPAKPGHRKTSR